MVEIGSLKCLGRALIGGTIIPAVVLLASKAQAAITQVTNVQLNQTDSGIEVLLETVSGNAPQVFTSGFGSTFFADLVNTRIANSFRQNNPIPGIALVTVEPLGTNTIRVTVVGEGVRPVVKVTPTANGLAFAATSEQTARTPEETLTPPQAPTTEPTPTVGSRETIPEEDEETIVITVTAEKREENVQDVPISLTVITEGEAEDADITTLEGIAANTPNFSTFGTGRDFLTYSIRGLSNNNFLSRDAVAFYIDDVPYDYGSFINLDIPEIERVEVLRGPQATLYGRNAQAGVVNVITRKPTDEFVFRGTASYSNFDNPDFRLSASGPIVDDRLFFRLSGNYESRDGYILNTFLDEDIDNRAGGGGRAQLLWTPSENWQISFNASLEDYRDGSGAGSSLDASNPLEIERDFNGFNNLNSNSQSLKISYNNPDFQVTSITTRRYSLQDFDAEADSTIADIIRRPGRFESTVFSQELRLQSPNNANNFQWLLGGYFESREFDIIDDGLRFGADAAAIGSVPGNDFTDADTEQTTWAAFAQVSYRPIEALNLTAGLRYESVNDELESRRRNFIPADGSPSFPSGETFEDIEQNEDILLPRFVIEYRFNPNVAVYGTIARGYKPAGVNYRSETRESLTFDAEKSWNYELGLKSSWLNNRLFVNLAAFHNPVNDFQVALPDEIGFVREIANAEVTITGFELEARAIPVRGLEVIAGFGYTDAEFDEFENPFSGQNFDGNKLVFAPEFTYNLAIQYRANFGLFARAELQGFGTTYFDDANDLKQDPFALVNLRIGYEFGRNGIYLFANNIFDTRYLVSAFAFGQTTSGTTGAPATFGIQFRSSF